METTEQIRTDFINALNQYVKLGNIEELGELYIRVKNIEKLREPIEEALIRRIEKCGTEKDIDKISGLLEKSGLSDDVMIKGIGVLGEK